MALPRLCGADVVRLRPDTMFWCTVHAGNGRAVIRDKQRRAIIDY